MTPLVATTFLALLVFAAAAGAVDADGTVVQRMTGEISVQAWADALGAIAP